MASVKFENRHPVMMVQHGGTYFWCEREFGKMPVLPAISPNSYSVGLQENFISIGYNFIYILVISTRGSF